MDISSTRTSPSDDDPTDAIEPERYGPYVVVGPLGAGGMGIVVEARDPVLQRHVALKLLRPRPAWVESDGATRLVFEAQAMARLAHPNVVTVFEVGQDEDQVYVAMELVRGTTLRAWLRARPRRWREIVEIFLGAGRGLAAAHAAGLVHRDFKPDNVLIGADGRPQVTDFGLVVESSADAEAVQTAIGDDDVEATFRGSVMGTPAYMSREQWEGRAVDARADQFAFCVALWEALYGERPFPGNKPSELRLAVQAGVLVDPPRGRTPRWLLALVRRGLARDPAARWPDLTTLLDELARRLRVRRAWTVAAITAAIAIATATATAGVVATVAATSPCAAPTARLAAVWSAAQRETLRQHLIAVDPVQGATRYAKIAAALDAGAGAWSTMHVDACRATRVEGRQSDTLLDRRMVCLDRWLGELGTTVDVVGKASSSAEVDKATGAATSLSALDRCADVRALSDAPPPSGLVDRATAAALGAEIQAVDVAQRAGRFDGLPARARALVSAARGLHHAPTLAAALVVEARVLVASKTLPLAEPTLRELVQVAARNRDDRDEAFAWLNLARLPDHAALIDSARAAVLRAGEPLELRIDLLECEAALLNDSPRPRDGLALLVEARRLLEPSDAGVPSSPLAARLANVMFETGQSYLVVSEYDAAATSYRAAIERYRGVFGADSLGEAGAAHHLAMALQGAGKLEDALAAAREAVRIYRARLGDTPTVVRSMIVEAQILEASSRWQAAVAVYDEALGIDLATRTPSDLTRAALLMARAVSALHFGKHDEAARDIDQAVALYEAYPSKGTNLAIALFNRAEFAVDRGAYDDAIRDYARALVEFEKRVEPGSHYLLYPLTGQAAALVRAGRPAAAIPLLERGLRLKPDVGDALQVGRARAYLGRARVESGRDVAGGMAMALAARAAIAAEPEGKTELIELDRWLAAHRR